MNTLVYFCLDLTELNNCKTELSIDSHINFFENAFFFNEFKQFLNDYIKTIKNLIFWEHRSKDYHIVDFLNFFQNIKVCLFNKTFIYGVKFY